MTTRMHALFEFGKAKESSVRPGSDAAAEARQAVPPLSQSRQAITALIDEYEQRRTAAAQKDAAVKTERRHRRRVKISAPIRIRQSNVPHANEYDMTMTSDVSREGVLFESSRANYFPGQEVAVVFPYRPAPGEAVKEERGQVVRVVRASEKRYGIAVAFLSGPPVYELVDAQGRPLGRSALDPVSQSPEPEKPRSARPLVVLVDAEPRLRLELRARLEREGYTVEAFSDPGEAVTLLRHRVPKAIVCESEPFPDALPGGGEMSGYDLCVVVRRNQRLSGMPVILTTRSGLPSDFSTAHALGATVCVAKPYDMSRITNLLLLLVPVEAK